MSGVRRLVLRPGAPAMRAQCVRALRRKSPERACHNCFSDRRFRRRPKSVLSAQLGVARWLRSDGPRGLHSGLSGRRAYSRDSAAARAARARRCRSLLGAANSAPVAPEALSAAASTSTSASATRRSDAAATAAAEEHLRNTREHEQQFGYAGEREREHQRHSERVRLGRRARPVPRVAQLVHRGTEIAR